MIGHERATERWRVPAEMYALFNAAFVIAAPLVGKLGDRIGRTRIVVLSYLIYLVMSLGFAFALANARAQDQGMKHLNSAKPTPSRSKVKDGLLFRTRAPNIEGIRRRESGCSAGPRPAGTTWCRSPRAPSTPRYYYYRSG